MPCAVGVLSSQNSKTYTNEDMAWNGPIAAVSNPWRRFADSAAQRVRVRFRLALGDDSLTEEWFGGINAQLLLERTEEEENCDANLILSSCTVELDLNFS